MYELIWESRKHVFLPSRSGLVVQSCFCFFPCSKSRDLGPEHGFRAFSFKNKRKKLDFHENVKFWGVKKAKKNEKVERNWSKFGLRSSRWYQKDPEGRRGYFRKIWASTKIGKNQNVLRDFPCFFRGLSNKNREFPYKRPGATFVIVARGVTITWANLHTNDGPCQGC